MNLDGNLIIRSINTAKRTVIIEKAPVCVCVINYDIPIMDWNYWYAQGETYQVKSFNNQKQLYDSYIYRKYEFHYSEVYMVISHKNSVARALILKTHCKILK